MISGVVQRQEGDTSKEGLGKLLGFSIFYFWLHRAACRILDPPPGTKPMPTAVEVHSLNHWTTKEAPAMIFEVGSKEAVPHTLRDLLLRSLLIC